MFNNFFPKIKLFIRQCVKCGIARQATDDNTTRHTRFSSWITRATYTHSEYVILNASPWQQWFRERALMLRYRHTAYLVYITLDGTYSLTYDMPTRQIPSYVLLNFATTPRSYRRLSCDHLNIRYRPTACSGGESPATHRRKAGSIPGPAMWDLWWHWDRLLAEYFGLACH
jgi:hypothetical protein